MNKLIEESKKQLELEKINQGERDLLDFKKLLKEVFGADLVEYIEVVDSNNANFIGSKYGVEKCSWNLSSNGLVRYALFLRDREYSGAYFYNGYSTINKLSDLADQISKYEKWAEKNKKI